MKVVHYIKGFNFDAGGPVRAILDLATVMLSRGHEIALLTHDDTDAPSSWTRALPLPEGGGRGKGLSSSSSSPIARTLKLDPLKPPLGTLVRADRARAAAEIERADILHLHGVWEPSSAQIAAIARRIGVPYVLSVRGMLDDWCMAQRGVKKRLYLALAGRRMLERAARVHLTAQAEFDQARKWFPRGRGVVIPNLLDLEPYRELPGPEAARAKFAGLRTGRPTLLFLSRLHYKKGVEALIAAAAELRDQTLVPGGPPGVQVLVAGSGDAEYRRKLDSLVASLKIEDRVAFLGHVGGTEKLSLYQAADLFVLPTSQENFGFVFYEALACGTPIVTTRGVDTWPELESSGAAAIVDVDTGSGGGESPGRALAAAIRSMLGQGPRLKERGAAGRRWVFQTLDPTLVIEQFEKMYDEAREIRSRAT